jgi:hypothetical protein
MNQKRLDKFCPDGIPKYVRCYDNKGETIDRYTAVFTGNYAGRKGCDYLGMNSRPFHPIGFGQHGWHETVIDTKNGWPPKIGQNNHLGTRIEFADLPEDCRRCVLQDYLILWRICEENEVTKTIDKVFELQPARVR